MGKVKLSSIAAAGLSVLALGACTANAPLTEVPVPTHFSQEAMYKLSSVSHWNAVAVDMASDAVRKYSVGRACIPGMLCEATIYVKPQAQETRFTLAFRTQLISALVNQGMPVVSKPDSTSTTVEVETQVLLGSSPQVAVEYDREPTELFSGIWVIKDFKGTGVKKFANAPGTQWTEGAAKYSAWFRSGHFVPAAEILVTVSFVNNNRYMARTSNMYYVADPLGYLATPKGKAGEDEKVARTVKVPVIGDCTSPRCETR
ncbi:MAG: hypothetical protein VW257_11040 [Quisquiliibacterium sp.]